MALKDDILGNLEGFSVAKYSTWMYYKPIRTLFDAGEGLSTHMRNFAFGAERVFLSHGHHDHIGGLPGLVLSRASARGDKEKPLTIYHPIGWDSIHQIKEYIRVVGGNLPFKLTWIPIDKKRKIIIGDDKSTLSVKVFPTHHGYRPTLGYAVVEKRDRLRSDLVGKSGSEIAEIAKREGRGAVKESYEHMTFAYSGDSSPINPDFVRGVEVLVHEATFVDPEDFECDRNGHSSVVQAIRVANDAEAKSLVLCHFSSRYSKSEAISCINNARKQIQYPGDITLFWKDCLIRIY